MDSGKLWMIGGIAAAVITVVAVMGLLATRVVRIPSNRAAVIIGRPSIIEIQHVEPVAMESKSTLMASTEPAAKSQKSKGGV